MCRIVLQKIFKPMNKSKIVLYLGGIGHVKGKKNNKLMARGRLITKPEYQDWIKYATRVIESQLPAVSQTTDAGIWTGAQQPCSTSSPILPEDDSWQWIPELVLRAEPVPKGQEGAVITIEQL